MGLRPGAPPPGSPGVRARKGQPGENGGPAPLACMADSRRGEEAACPAAGASDAFRRTISGGEIYPRGCTAKGNTMSEVNFQCAR